MGPCRVRERSLPFPTAIQRYLFYYTTFSPPLRQNTLSSLHSTLHPQTYHPSLSPSFPRFCSLLLHPLAKHRTSVDLWSNLELPRRDPWSKQAVHPLFAILFLNIKTTIYKLTFDLSFAVPSHEGGGVIILFFPEEEDRATCRLVLAMIPTCSSTQVFF